jgi:hypothetical protein
MVINAERLRVAVQAGFVENEDVIQTHPANGADDPLDINALPWRTWRSHHLLDSIAFTYSTKSAPNIRSRSRSRLRGALSNGNASRNC